MANPEIPVARNSQEQNKRAGGGSCKQTSGFPIIDGWDRFLYVLTPQLGRWNGHG